MTNFVVRGFSSFSAFRLHRLEHDVFVCISLEFVLAEALAGA